VTAKESPSGFSTHSKLSLSTNPRACPIPSGIVVRREGLPGRVRPTVEWNVTFFFSTNNEAAIPVYINRCLLIANTPKIPLVAYLLPMPQPLGNRVENVRSVGQRDEGLNQMIERVNNTVRDREKTFRGMDNDESAQTMADGTRINYNFIRPHMGLDGKTPAQIAGLDLGLDGIRWRSLIKRATQSAE
jgi:hypothetical protein